MTEVQKKAKRLGIRFENLNRADLIRKIQAREGHFPCFQIKGGSCDKRECCWRRECQVKIPGRSFHLIVVPTASTS
jgi:hypothetical protein